MCRFEQIERFFAIITKLEIQNIILLLFLLCILQLLINLHK
jgi:hypothetical protein